MTQEEKQLLLKDICARLPYDLIVRVLDINDPTYQKDGNLYNIKYLEGDYNGMPYLFDVDNQACLSDITEIQPYLRPMSSMTNEETDIFNSDFGGIEDSYNSIEIKRIDWLNANHFDYRNLIEKGLAIEAPKGMYNL